MSRFRNLRDQNLQLPFPGCIGNMINIFDLSAGITGTKLLTDRAHRDDSPVRRSKSDTKKATHPISGYVDDKQRCNKTKRRSSSQRSGGTTMKMLIAEEMSKEKESSRKSPCVVARLMGLDDDMPVQQPSLAASKRSLHGDYPRAELAGSREQDVPRRVIPHDLHQHNNEKMEFKDIHEVSVTKDQYAQWGNCKGNDNDKRMALVQQKFTEAKRLATDEKLLHSQEFHDALEVLSSNRDLFLKFLEEPRSIFSKQVNDIESIPPLAQRRQITILKPSKTPEAKSEMLVMKQKYGTADNMRCELNKPHWNSNYRNLKAKGFSQPTKIVVLKPGTEKPHGMKDNITYPKSPELQEQKYLSGDSEDSDDLGPRHIKKGFTQQILEMSNRHRRDESLLSSVYSNGYGGDESSFHMSESEYIEEDGGCFSDSETVTPTLRHSWDCTKKLDSPFSVSSFSRDSYSPESSVIREAKKRLSERWALVASRGFNQGLPLRRSSSTLGEMVSIHDIKKQEKNQTSGQTSFSKSYVQENELKSPASCLPISRAKDAEGNSSGRILSRSKSVPVSCSTFDDITLKVEASSTKISKSTKSKEVEKPKKGKLSFKSLLFSKHKKLNREEPISLPQRREKPDSPHLVGLSDKMQSADTPLPVDGKDELLTPRDLPMESPQNYDEGFRTASPKPVIDGPKEDICSPQKPRIKDDYCDTNALRTNGTLSANQDQPSPTSVLDAPFEDEGNESTPPSESDSRHHKQLSRASTIDSVARVLSWNDSHTVLSSPKSSRSENAEHECIALVQKLLLSAGLQTTNKLFAGWHSLDSPIDPMLFDTFCDHKGEETMYRENSSNMRLLFDCVNSTLLDISRTAFLSAYPWTNLTMVNHNDVYPCSKLSSDVSGLVIDWFSGKGAWVSAESENSNQMVDTVLRREVGGKAWAESMKLEVEDISKEISGELLDDLVVEAFADFTDIH